MATAKQIAANRRNAQRSTGPRTAAGRSMSSRNALRHGLSLPQEKNAATAAAIDELAQLIAPDGSDNQKLLDVEEAATALLQSAEESYNAALEAYNYGVRNLLDVTAAQRALAQARTANISAQTQVLTTLAELAFRTGDLLRTSAKSGKP